MSERIRIILSFNGRILLANSRRRSTNGDWAEWGALGLGYPRFLTPKTNSPTYPDVFGTASKPTDLNNARADAISLGRFAFGLSPSH